MEKCSSILVVVRELASSDALLDKAAILARRFGARLELLLDDSVDTCVLATRFAALGLEDQVSFALQRSDEPLNDVILAHLKNRPADLVMKSADTARALRRLLRTADDMALAARLRVPLLRVGAKPWRAEMRFAAAVDVSDRDSDAVARAIVHAAGLIASRCEATLDVLYSEREATDDRVRMERAVRMARLVREFHVGGERLRVLEGAPDRTLPKAISAGDFDLVVVGAIPRKPKALPWTPSLTSLLASSNAGDVMLVPETTRAERDGSRRARSKRAAGEAHP
jgi:hypothetical protein